MFVNPASIKALRFWVPSGVGFKGDQVTVKGFILYLYFNWWATKLPSFPPLHGTITSKSPLDDLCLSHNSINSFSLSSQSKDCLSFLKLHAEQTPLSSNVILGL